MGGIVKRVIVASLLLAMLALLVWGLWGAVAGPDRIEQRAFDAGSWQAAEFADDGSSPRLGMVPDLVRRHLHIGTERKTVVDLLGEPEAEQWSESYPYPGWSIGKIPTPSDGTGLCIQFDAQDRVQAIHFPYWAGSEGFDDARYPTTIKNESTFPLSEPSK